VGLHLVPGLREEVLAPPFQAFKEPVAVRRGKLEIDVCNRRDDVDDEDRGLVGLRKVLLLILSAD